MGVSAGERYTGAMRRVLYDRLMRPVLFRINPETAHHLAMHALGVLSASDALCRAVGRTPDPRLARTVFGLRFPSPVGLAAGFDKSAQVLPAWAALGFGFVEAGTITPRPQPGNPRPRVFRYPDLGALVNRMGFNNDGAAVVAERLGKLRASGRWPQIPIGMNLGKNKDTPLEAAAADYTEAFDRLRPFADYVALNISSPNTPGLRTLQGREALEPLIDAVQARNLSKAPVLPILVKLAPDLGWEEIETLIEVAQRWGASGLIATNTTLDHSCIAGRDQAGGLSGAPLRARSTEVLRFIAERTRLPVIASGGVMDTDSALEKFDAGAALVQVYTGFVYRGPELLREIEAALLRRMG
jgi:dihydroorotate dehydrogenase